MATQLLFDDILLNSSVPREDQDRLSRQRYRMLKLFTDARRTQRTLSTLDLMECGAQYQAILYDLRRHLIPCGFCIDLVQRGKGGVNHYAIVPLDESEWYKKRKDRL